MHTWADILRPISHLLPDVDLAMNSMDEPRLLVPWDDVEHYMEVAERKHRETPFPTSPAELTTSFPSLPRPVYAPLKYDHEIQVDGALWAMAREACPPDSPGRTADWNIDYSQPPHFPMGFPDGSLEGYVQNWTIAKDPCTHSHIRELHGSFVEPVNLSISRKMFPLFGECKMNINNDIVVPATNYWKDPLFSTGMRPLRWETKNDKMVWRGAASGGRNREDNWRRFQRHRFVSMLNGTQVHASSSHTNDAFPRNFATPESDLYKLSPGQANIGQWLDDVTDVAFSDLHCYPDYGNVRLCPYDQKYYSVPGHLAKPDHYKYKFLPDVDGDTISVRYREFLASNSLPIKATIYKEWHDSRLIAWKHFVPMDNTYKDIYGIMEYFMGYDGEVENKTPVDHVTEGNIGGFYGGYEQAEAAAGEGTQVSNDFIDITKRQRVHKDGHDAQAQAIAEDGRDWAFRVLRHVDMQIYFYRLILEFARLCSDDRDRMGYADGTSPMMHTPETGTGEVAPGAGYNGHAAAEAGYGAWSDGASPALPAGEHGHTAVADGGAPIEEGPGEGAQTGAKTEGVGHGAAEFGTSDGVPEPVPGSTHPSQPDAPAGYAHHGYGGAADMAPPPETPEPEPATPEPAPAAEHDAVHDVGTWGYGRYRRTTSAQRTKQVSTKRALGILYILLRISGQQWVRRTMHRISILMELMGRGYGGDGRDETDGA